MSVGAPTMLLNGIVSYYPAATDKLPLFAKGTPNKSVQWLVNFNIKASETQKTL
jgi:hypothetical protein